jgi:hypothetical protein
MTEIINRFQACLQAIDQRRAEAESTMWEQFKAARRQGVEMARVVTLELSQRTSSRSESRKALRQEWGMA